LGAQIDLAANARLDVDVDPAFEHGVLCDLGTVEMGGAPLAAADLGYQAPGHSILQLRNVGDRAARVLLLGGSPFAEQLVMWWNFVGRSHDEIARYRQQWEDADQRFGVVEGYRGSIARLPAPALPTVRLRP
jgi:redox-sensitive bicupin YhaK (pirin superfamily)